MRLEEGEVLRATHTAAAWEEVIARHMRAAALAAELAAAAPPPPPPPPAAAAAAPGRGAARQLRQGASAGCGAPRPIRVHAEYQGTSGLDLKVQKQLRDTFAVATKVLQKYFSVKCRPPGRLRTSPQCLLSAARADGSFAFCARHAPDMLGASGGGGRTCGLAALNASHVAPYKECYPPTGQECREFKGGEGEDADYYIYVTAKQDEGCSQPGVGAWAVPCILDTKTHRPVMGAINVCPADVSRKALIDTIVHEMLHALGFTSNMHEWTAKAIVTPTVIREARAQSGCATLPGGFLENEGGQGSANEHWESRLYQGEVMLPSKRVNSGKPDTVSRMTLAYMQDTGWYDVNWDNAGFLSWGYKAGCDFAMGNCEAFMRANPKQQYFCSPGDAERPAPTCTYDGFSLTTCRGVSFMDGCPVKVALSGSANCLNPKDTVQLADMGGWSHGCVPLAGPLVLQQGNRQLTRGRTLQVDVLGRLLDCPAGKMVPLSAAGFKAGSLGPCPDASQARRSANRDAFAAPWRDGCRSRLTRGTPAAVKAAVAESGAAAPPGRGGQPDAAAIPDYDGPANGTLTSGNLTLLTPRKRAAGADARGPRLPERPARNSTKTPAETDESNATADTDESDENGAAGRRAAAAGTLAAAALAGLALMQ
ncbi:MAG: hypothetical protein J3K34DRAFT_466746 [Monoraphidium minutum]|nr:MAG: hypothetical protein J3K34DRAFT_466746 [Monoraphidium minutum]